MSAINTNAHLSIAQEAATLAGKFLVKNDRSRIQVNAEEGKDIKIDADVQSEKVILDHLIKHTPYSILSEEKGLMEREESDYLWVVDPLDGTMNYFRGIPVCCTSIGLWRDGEPVSGVVYNFNTQECFTGIVGEGAWLNGEQISVTNMDNKEKAVLSTGFPSYTDFSDEAVKSFVVDLQTYKKIRMIGSAAMSICYVACGRVDAYYERDIMFWDIAGGIPVVLGAGGTVEKVQAKAAHAFNVFISNGKLGSL